MNETIGNQPPSSSIKLGWLAGIIDGEGCLQLAKQKYRDRFHYRPQIVIGNTNPKIIEEIRNIAKEFELPIYILEKRYRAMNSTSMTEVVQIMGLKRVQKWLEIITPYLIGKKEQAIIVKNFIQHRLEQPNSFSGLNTFGEKDLEFRKMLDLVNHQYRTRTAQRLHAELIP